MPIYRSTCDGQEFFNILDNALKEVVKAAGMQYIILSQSEVSDSPGAYSYCFRDFLILAAGNPALAVHLKYRAPTMDLDMGYVSVENYTGSGNLDDMNDNLKAAATLLNEPTGKETKEVAREGTWSITSRSQQLPDGVTVSGTVFEADKLESAFLSIIGELAQAKKQP